MRLPAQQHWPWLKNRPKCEVSIAWSISASAKTTFGLLPPSSRVTRFRLDDPAACIISFPTSVEPIRIGAIALIFAMLHMCTWNSLIRSDLLTH